LLGAWRGWRTLIREYEQDYDSETSHRMGLLALEGNVEFSRRQQTDVGSVLSFPTEPNSTVFSGINLLCDYLASSSCLLAFRNDEVSIHGGMQNAINMVAWPWPLHLDPIDVPFPGADDLARIMARQKAATCRLLPGQHFPSNAPSQDCSHSSGICRLRYQAETKPIIPRLRRIHQHMHWTAIFGQDDIGIAVIIQVSNG
jgi:hypothetical protein